MRGLQQQRSNSWSPGFATTQAGVVRTGHDGSPFRPADPWCPAILQHGHSFPMHSKVHARVLWDGIDGQFIVDLLFKDGDFPVRYFGLPEGNQHNW